MREYIAYQDDGTARRLFDPKWDAGWEDRHLTGFDLSRTSAYRIDGYAPIGLPGVPWCEELSGPSGMHFTLFQLTCHDATDIRKAKAWLRDRRDVTGFIVLKVRQWSDVPKEVPA
jgi:hypothetical protein